MVSGNVGIGTFLPPGSPLYIYNTADTDAFDVVATGLVNNLGFNLYVPGATSKAFGVTMISSPTFDTEI